MTIGPISNWTFYVQWSDDPAIEKFTVQARDREAAWSELCNLMFKAGCSEAGIPIDSANLQAILVSRQPAGV